ncbi:ribonuclease HIII [Victivallis sp. Marseille-Q1083]|uniref:ribonuclease HIII n=1 Tax=Victivallis sp. Marseille-Q1083 TaxID=2717288 RepID=UPI00158E8784|nr:ribonuclease HIII [Victivallis sp. Marseille-Q1083]
MPNVAASKVTSYVAELSAGEIERLAALLRERGWEFKEQPYAHWKAVGEKVNVVAYRSGKLTVQGGGTADFVLFTLEPEILHRAGFGYERNEEAAAEEILPHGGIDESGKGDFFGPLVIAGVCVDADSGAELLKLGVRDSKTVKSGKKIAELASGIRRIVGGRWTVVTILPERYNQLYRQIGNLNRFLAWGHARVIENLLERVPECPRMLSDKFGAEHLIRNALMSRGRRVVLEQQTKAERDVAVAAASILAREGFLNGMNQLAALAGCELPRGASATVAATALELARARGIEILDRLTKTHFKTYAELIDRLMKEGCQ